MSQTQQMDPKFVGVVQTSTNPNDLSSKYMHNGIENINSTQDMSAGLNINNTPQSQVPFPKMSIPPSQLPPSSRKPTISEVTQSYANMNLDNMSKDITPFPSPNVQKFNTSTPVQENFSTSNVNAVAANRSYNAQLQPPVGSNVQTFSHSATSQFSTPVKTHLAEGNNVPLDMKSTKNLGNTISITQANDSGVSSNNMYQSYIFAQEAKKTKKLEINTISNNMQTPISNTIPSSGVDVKRVILGQEKMQTNLQKPNIMNNQGFISNNYNSTQSPTPATNYQNATGNVPISQRPQYSNIHPITSNSSPSTQFTNYPVTAPLNFSNNMIATTLNSPPATQPIQKLQQQNTLDNFKPSVSYSNYTQYSNQQSARQNTMSYDYSKSNINNQQNYNSNLPQNISAPPKTNFPSSDQQNFGVGMSNQTVMNTGFHKPPNMYSSQNYEQHQKPQQQNMNQYYQSNSQFSNASIQNLYSSNQGVVNSGFSRLWGHENFDLLQCPNILPVLKLEAPRVSLGQDSLDSANCSPDIFRCTMTKIPETSNLLQKSRLPLGVLIHPFKDLNHLPVIQCNTIVRCRACRTYINPFVFFVDSKRWKCNLCGKVNELPEEFLFDPVSKTYGDPSRRPEIKSSTIEYIAPAEYMLRPPQPAIYLFLLDVSRAAVECGYLQIVCTTLQSELKNLPGDARMQVGFIAYDSSLHFFNLGEGLSQPHELTVMDIDDAFLPCPDNLLVNLQDRIELVSDLLVQLPMRYHNTFDTGSALGAALQVAYKMMSSTGGRVTVFQVSLPTVGPGLLTPREDPTQRSSSDVQHLNPANDFYKRLALDCSGQQIAVDLFILNSMYVDLATLSGISRFSGGCIHHIPLFKNQRKVQCDTLEKMFRRYLLRKIGFEAVMRIRCTRGLSIHTFHGNFFVRSTDLLSLPNINPDAGFGMQVAIEENLSDIQTVCFQAALLYTSSKGERRIRVHTLCLPVVSSLTDVINSADQQCIIGLLAKMAVDRSIKSSLSDAREAFLNVAIDILSSYKVLLNMGSGTSGLLAPNCLRLLPLYISALLKHTAFRSGTPTRLDDRVKAMCDMKAKPLPFIMQQIYPDLYPIHNLEEHPIVINDEEEQVHLPPVLQLTSRSIDANGAYLLDTGEHIIIMICQNIMPSFINNVLGLPRYNSIQDSMYTLPLLENLHNNRLHMFINYLNEEKPYVATLQIIRDDSVDRHIFFERLIEDRVETALSYHEFLQHLKTQVK